MWARVVELMLGCWLAMSPFIFRHSTNQTSLWTNDLVCAATIVTLSLLSFWRPLRRLHLINVVVALWLIGFGFLLSSYPAPPALQNDIAAGLLLVMLAVIPSEAVHPPQSWRDFYTREME